MTFINTYGKKLVQEHIHLIVEKLGDYYTNCFCDQYNDCGCKQERKNNTSKFLNIVKQLEFHMHHLHICKQKKLWDRNDPNVMWLHTDNFVLQECKRLQLISNNVDDESNYISLDKSTFDKKQ